MHHARAYIVKFLIVLALFLIGFNTRFFSSASLSRFRHEPVSEPVVIPAGGEAANPIPAAPAFSLRVERLEIQAPLVFASSTQESDIQAALQKGIVHMPGTALPGEPGNCYVMGHSSDVAWAKGDFSTVFRRLPEIKKGDIVTMQDAEGAEYRYRVFLTDIVRPSNLKYLDQEGKQRTLLTLQTSYPVGTAWGRFIAQAELVEE